MALCACGGGSDGSGPGTGAGSGSADMGPPGLTCDPVENTGCEDPPLCRVRTTFDDGVCEIPTGDQALGQGCDENTQDCGGGLICGPLPGQEPSCLAVCDLTEDRGCGDAAVCRPLEAGDRFGVCIPTCDPFDAESCQEGQACFDIGGPGRQCLPTGTGVDDDPCQQPEDCAALHVCVGLEGGRCEPICDPSDSPPSALCSNPEEVCLGLVDQNDEPLDFGFCGEVPACNLFDVASCPMNQGCALTADFDYPVCIPVGQGTEGQLCGGMNSGCEAGLICVGSVGQAACRRPCNEFNMCAGAFACAALDSPFDEFGACVPM